MLCRYRDETDLTALESRFRGRIGGRIVHLRQASSTMDVAREMLAGVDDARDLHGVAIVADEQTKGRGRFERAWHSEPGEDILVSLILCPRLSISGQLTVMASLAAALTVDAVTSCTSDIKWPNDVIVEGKKICGVIAESLTIGDAFACIVGIGLNVNMLVDPNRPKDYDATSIRKLSGADVIVDRSEVLVALLEETNELYDALDRGETIMPEWRSKLITLGSRVEVTMANQNSGGEVITGFAEDIDDFGRLLIREDDGVLRAVAAGEVTMQMPDRWKFGSKQCH